MDTIYILYVRQDKQITYHRVRGQEKMQRGIACKGGCGKFLAVESIDTKDAGNPLKDTATVAYENPMIEIGEDGYCRHCYLKKVREQGFIRTGMPYDPNEKIMLSKVGIGALASALERAKPCPRHNRENLFICIDCFFVRCWTCNGRLCTCTGD